jgi:magnesium-transporting ATPase (P-type)
MVAILTLVGQFIRIALEFNGLLPCGCTNLMTCQPPQGDTCEELAFTFKNRMIGEILNTIIISITVVVVAIPEGLPLAVTISLSFSSAKMRKLQNLVRTLASSETMGGATHICSDKTGTLTQNKMTVMGCYTLGKAHYMGDSVNDKLAKSVMEATENVTCDDKSVWDSLKEGIMWNSSARIEANDGKDPLLPEAANPFVLKGNVTEMGIIKFFINAFGFEGCNSARADLEDSITAELVSVISFSSKRKMASVVVRNIDLAGTDKEIRLYTKGAPDMLFKKTNKAISADGSVVGMDDTSVVSKELLLPGEEDGVEDTNMNIYERAVKNFANKAYRTILVSYKDMTMEEYNFLKQSNNDFEKEADKECLECELTAVGIFGLQDPLRGTIKDSIQKCKEAGIKVIMCTGDNIDTATAISKDAGIVTDELINMTEDSKKYTCMIGEDFRRIAGGIIEIATGEQD